MNKQDEDKVKEILNKHFGHPVKEGSDEWYTLNYQNRFRDLQEMASWKEQQMIKKAVKYLDNMLILDDGNTDVFIEDFKKYMEEQ